MNQSSSNSEKDPETPQPKIEQNSSGNSVGGQQAVIGDNNVQYQDNRAYYNFYLQDSDLEPLSFWGKFFSYFKVLVFLAIIWLSWVLLGPFTSFTFPYGEVLDLMFSCFKGTIASKVNRLQQTLGQLENLDAQPVEELNKFDSQVRLHLGVLRHLGANKNQSHERIAKTINFFKQKKGELQDGLKPRQPKGYRIATQIQDFFESISLSKTEKDLIQIQSILNEVTLAIRNNYPSETIIQDTIDKLFQVTSWKAKKISPFRLAIIYNIENLLREISDKNISNLGESELRQINRKIIEKNNDLLEEISNIRDENRIAKQDIVNYLHELNRITSRLNESEFERSKTQEKLKKYAETNENQERKVNNLNLQLNQANHRIRDLESKKTSLSKNVEWLNQDIDQKQALIDQLNNKLKKYSAMRSLEGNYIGNISNKGSCYHFNQDCRDWKMLVGDYILKLDLSRTIKSSSSPDLFEKAGLKKCKNCIDASSKKKS